MKQDIPKITNAIIFACSPTIFPRLVEAAENEDGEALAQALVDSETADPMSTQWDSVGFTKMPTLDWFARSDNHVTFNLQINERKLPSKVRDELVTKKIAEIERTQGRKPHKKEMRLLIEEAEMELLPKAFIIRNHVLVSFTKDAKLVIWTSSMKRAERITMLAEELLLMVDKTIVREFRQISHRSMPADVFTRMVKTSPGDDDKLDCGFSCVLKSSESADAPTIRVRNRDLDASDIQTLVQSGEDYKVIELEMLFDESGNFSTHERNVGCTFTVNEGLIFKKLKIPGVTRERGTDAVDAFDTELFLTLAMLLKARDALSKELGGEGEPVALGEGVQYEDDDEI